MNLSFISNFGWILRVLVIRGGNIFFFRILRDITDCPQSAQPQSVAGASNPRVSLPREGEEVRSKVIFDGGFRTGHRRCSRAHSSALVDLVGRMSSSA